MSECGNCKRDKRGREGGGLLDALVRGGGGVRRFGDVR